MRDSGLDISYALREGAIKEKRASFKNASENGFNVGTYEELIPTADLVSNLTPDKQHTAVVKAVMPLMKQGATLSYSHGFNIVEEGMEVRKDITVIMIAPKSPGSEVREEYKRGFGVPTLIAVHPENDPEGKGFEQAKAYAAATGGDRAGVLNSSFVAEVKSDLMGEQTILCGLLQTGVELAFETMTEAGIKPESAYYESLHETPLIANTIARKKLFEMNRVISDTAEYGCYLFDHACKPLLTDFMKNIDVDVIGTAYGKDADASVENQELIAVNKAIRQHPVESIGESLRASMTAMKKIV
ncbi:UNVERIFIED_CONTAM: hypothetical protein GTU68_052004 [Idotea baltica]|nr:hypothetical protein [Idotea baltica]